jgi:hypothetical protein
MSPELIEHAARLLRHAPAGGMTIDTLWERARAETGQEAGIRSFLEAIRSRSDVFTVLEPPAQPPDMACWEPAEREAYGSLVLEAGADRPVVTLADASVEQQDEPAWFTGTQATLADLLRTAGHDESLRQSVRAAVAELEAAYGAGRQGVQEPIRRSSTLHHCSSASSASITKPAASAAARTCSDSSSRMPESMAHPPPASPL